MTSNTTLKIFMPSGLCLRNDKLYLTLNAFLNVQKGFLLVYQDSDYLHRYGLSTWLASCLKCKFTLLLQHRKAAEDNDVIDVTEILSHSLKSGMVQFTVVYSSEKFDQSLNQDSIQYGFVSSTKSSDDPYSSIINRSNIIIGLYNHLQSIQRHFNFTIEQSQPMMSSTIIKTSNNENYTSQFSKLPIITSIYKIYDVQSIFIKYIFNFFYTIQLPWSFRSVSNLFNQISIIHNCELTKVKITKEKQLLDFSLGFFMLLFLLSFSNVPMLCQHIIDTRDTAEIYLNGILEWLMGVPAGLKLNKELSEFLGKFFYYHIQVWITYLTLLEPYYPIIIKGVIISNIFGLTVFLSFLNDIVNILTFHIYCYYVYASKIYGLQFTALVSLARLFTGKKWNVLKKRVDSISHDKEDLALGTILFTTLLFLLPTTALYYVVFTAIRMPILLLKTTLDLFVSFINNFPISELWIRTWYPQDLEGELQLRNCGVKIIDGCSENKIKRYLQRYNQSKLQVSSFHEITTIKLVEIPPSYFKIIKQNIPLNTTITFGSLIKKLLRGDIISPWVSTKKETI